MRRRTVIFNINPVINEVTGNYLRLVTHRPSVRPSLVCDGVRVLKRVKKEKEREEEEDDEDDHSRVGEHQEGTT